MKGSKYIYKIIFLFALIFILGFFTFSRYIFNTIDDVKSLEQTVAIDSSTTADPQVFQILE